MEVALYKGSYCCARLSLSPPLPAGKQVVTSFTTKVDPILLRISSILSPAMRPGKPKINNKLHQNIAPNYTKGCPNLPNG